MTFEIHSDITNRSMAIASRAMRKVLRRKHSIIWAVFGWSVFLFNALLLILSSYCPCLFAPIALFSANLRYISIKSPFLTKILTHSLYYGKRAVG